MEEHGVRKGPARGVGIAAMAFEVGLGSERAQWGCVGPGIAVGAEEEGAGGAGLGGEVGGAEERVVEVQVGTEASDEFPLEGGRGQGRGGGDVRGRKAGGAMGDGARDRRDR